MFWHSDRTRRTHSSISQDKQSDILLLADTLLLSSSRVLSCRKYVIQSKSEKSVHLNLHSMPVQFWLFVWTWWLCTYNPVRIVERLGQQIGVVTYLNPFCFPIRNQRDLPWLELCPSFFHSFQRFWHKIHWTKFNVLVIGQYQYHIVLPEFKIVQENQGLDLTNRRNYYWLIRNEQSRRKIVVGESWRRNRWRAVWACPIVVIKWSANLETSRCETTNKWSGSETRDASRPLAPQLLHSSSNTHLPPIKRVTLRTDTFHSCDPRFFLTDKCWFECNWGQTEYKNTWLFSKLNEFQFELNLFYRKVSLSFFESWT